MKLPKFLICSNNSALPGAEFILHTRQPLVMAQVVKFNTHQECEEFIKTLTAYGKPYGHNVVISYVGLLSAFNVLDQQKYANELAGIMRRMSDWYLYNYIK